MERQKKFPCMKSLIIGRCQKIRKSSILDAFGAAAPKGQCPMEHRDEFLYVCLSIWMSVHPSIHTSPPGHKPQSSLSRPYIYQMEPRISSLRHETSPSRPEISSLRSNISPHRPKISPFQTDIRLLRDAQVFCYLFPESMKFTCVLPDISSLGYCPALTLLY